MRNGWHGIVLEDYWLPTVIARTFGFESKLRSQAGGEVRAIGKVNRDFRAIAAILKEREGAYYFPGEFFAFHHKSLWNFPLSPTAFGRFDSELHLNMRFIAFLQNI